MSEPLFFKKPVGDTSGLHVVIFKSRRLLEVYDGQTLVARLPAAMGRAAGPKLAQGDNRTPEGLYYVCMRNDKSKYHLSLGLSYPNDIDARRALEAGLITQEEHGHIADAIARRARPPWGTALGGEIMIHGGGADRDWTAGCIALNDEDMDYLWENIEMGASVEIVD